MSTAQPVELELMSPSSTLPIYQLWLVLRLFSFPDFKCIWNILDLDFFVFNVGVDCRSFLSICNYSIGLVIETSIFLGQNSPYSRRPRNGARTPTKGKNIYYPLLQHFKNINRGNQ